MSPFGIVPRAETLAAGDAWGTTAVIGTGPFKLSEWSPGADMRLIRNNDYFRSGQPHLDAIEVSFNVVAPVALERWRAGVADFVWFGEGASDVPSLQGDEEFRGGLRSGPGLTGSVLYFDLSNPVARDVRVRQAVASAIDKRAIATKTISADMATGLLPPSSPQFDPAFTGIPYDPARAKQLLAAAGFANGIDDFLIVTREPVAEVELIVAQLQDIGINAEVLEADPMTIGERVRAGAIAMRYASTRMDVTDAYDAFASLGSLGTCGESASRVLSQPCNDALVAQLNAAERLPLASAERTALYRRMQDAVINRDVSQVNVLWRQPFGLGSPRAHDDPLHPVYGLPMLEAAWMAQP
jgi:ABC-type transport system substrate-binding protein